MTREVEEEAKKVLDKLIDWVRAQGQSQQQASGSWKWITGLLVTAVALFSIGIMYWRAHKQGKEIAELKHERDLAAQRARIAKFEEKAAKATVWRDTIRRRALKAVAQVKSLDAEIKELENVNSETKKTIDDLKNWRDVDRYESRSGNSPR